MPISFPGLFGKWQWNPDPIAIHIGHGVYWYGIILAVAMLCGMYLSMKQAKHYGLTEEHITDLVLWAVPCCVIGSRIYYVLFNLSLYRNADGSLNLGHMIAIWDGGIAMYGTVIVGALVAFVYAQRKKIPLGALTDAAIPGLMLGQVIGRWANFINREAFGAATHLPWRMRIWITDSRSMDVHPTFFYESMWNLIGLMLILRIISKHRRFDGENTCFYFLWYGFGRFWIEGLRMDSLYFFHYTIFGQPIRVSQMLSFILSIGGAAALFWNIWVHPHKVDELLVSHPFIKQDNTSDSTDATEKNDSVEDTPTELHSSTDATEESESVEDTPTELHSSTDATEKSESVEDTPTELHSSTDATEESESVEDTSSELH